MQITAPDFSNLLTHLHPTYHAHAHARRMHIGRSGVQDIHDEGARAAMRQK